MPIDPSTLLPTRRTKTRIVTLRNALWGFWSYRIEAAHWLDELKPYIDGWFAWADSRGAAPQDRRDWEAPFTGEDALHYARVLVGAKEYVITDDPRGLFGLFVMKVEDYDKFEYRYFPPEVPPVPGFDARRLPADVDEAQLWFSTEDQSKPRMGGVWRNRAGIKNRLLLRVPHM